MSTTETTATAETTHEHSFPCQPPYGSIMSPGSCECGKTWALAQAEKAMAGALAAMEMAGMPPRPPLVCLCGSTRYGEAFAAANLERTLAGEIVLSIGCNMRDDDVFADRDEGELAEIKGRLDELHKRKIDMSDYVLVVSDETGYFGSSTRSEIAYAVEHGKPVRFTVAATEQRARKAGLLG
jgi:hypothetical protein